MYWLRETPKAFSTTFWPKDSKESRVMTSDIVITKKISDMAIHEWTIRRREPKSDVIGYGSLSETAKASVNNDGLINLSLLKVQSSLLGNLKE